MGDVLFEGVRQSGIELFAAHGIDLAAHLLSGNVDDHRTTGASLAEATPTAPTTFTSVAAFMSAQVHGYIVLSTTESVLCRSNGTTSPPDDWMAELANQFLGRFKNRLLRQGVQIQRMPPAVFRGQSTRLHNLHNMYEVLLSCGDAWVHIAVDLEPAVTFVEVDPPCDDTAVPAEGDLLLF
jgi:hypothetical protein